MARDRRQRVRRSAGVLGPVLRPAAWSALLSAAMATAVATPVQAAPVRAYTAPGTPGGVPDTGARPAPVGELRLPGAPATGTTSLPAAYTAGASPLAAKIEAKRIAVALAGEQLLRIREEQAQAATQVAAAVGNLRRAQEALARAVAGADAAAAESLKDAAALPPGTFGSDLHGLGALSPIQRGESVGQEAAAREVSLAQAAQRAADAEHTAAVSREQALATQYTTTDAARRRDEAALRQLQQDDSGQLAEYERRREAEEQRIGAAYIDNQSVAGMAAHPKALEAVRYALAQRGDDYVWSEEGPDEFDCSGLMYAAYRRYAKDPYPLPRVSRDQYYATRRSLVNKDAMLPGDLIFFSSSSSWTGIHHVAMYIGGGRMLHAPNAGDVVKVSTVWWSRMFAATRIYPAVPAPDAPATDPAAPPVKPPPATKPQPKPEVKPLPTKKPWTKPKPDNPSTSPSPADPTTPTPDTSVTPSPSPSATPSPTPSVAAATEPSETAASPTG